MFFQGQILYWPHLMNGWSDWHETKGLCIGLDLFSVKFRNSCISGMVGLVDSWPNMLPCPLTAPIKWPWNTCIKVIVGNSLISGLIYMERKGCESSIHGHDINFVVLSWWVGWMYSIVTRVTSHIGIASPYLFLVNVDVLYVSIYVSYIRKIYGLN